jgi:hypothetical protein
VRTIGNQETRFKEQSYSSVNQRTKIFLGEQVHHASKFRQLVAVRSTFVASLICFFALNGPIGRAFTHDRYDFPNHTFSWWAMQQWRALPTPPDVVFFGSSLIYEACSAGDANFLKRRVDKVLNHRSRFLEHLLRKTNRLETTFSLATPGQMASDTFAMQAALMSNSFKPKAIIWGIFPRDFVDNKFAGALSSDVARYMNRISDAPVVQDDHPSFWSMVERGLESAFPLLGQRDDILCCTRNFQRLISQELLYGRMNLSKFKRESFNPNSFQDVFTEMIPGILFSDPDFTSDKFIDNSEYYRARYARFDKRKFDLQCHYFDACLQKCNAQNIKVAIVNMPVTEDNLQMLPKGALLEYTSAVQSIVGKNHVRIYDFNEKGLFTRRDFADLVHLNGIGAEKFFQLLVTRVNWDELPPAQRGAGFLSSVRERENYGRQHVDLGRSK